MSNVAHRIKSQGGRSGSPAAGAGWYGRVSEVEAMLRNLCVEARRHAPAVVEAAERAVRTLRARASEYASSIHDASGVGSGATDGSAGGGDTHMSPAFMRSDDVLRPFLLAASDGRPKTAPLATSALGSVQRLIAMGAVAPQQAANIARVLAVQAARPSAGATGSAASTLTSIRLRVLQTLPLLLSSGTFELPMQLVRSALSSCLLLYACKFDPVIHHTASATLRQVGSPPILPP